jgi:glycosyltransferase involved in cell wall biosynthesis
MPRKTLIQVRHNYPGLMASCNEYLNAFDSRDYRKVVVFLLNPKDTTIAAQIPADEIIFLELQRHQLRTLPIRAVRALVRIFRDQAADLVLAHRYKPMQLTTLAAQWYSPPQVLLVMHALTEFRHISHRLFARLFWRNRYGFVGVSEAVKRYILESVGALPETRVLALFESLEVEKTVAALLPRAAARELLGLKESDRVLGHVARLVAEKDQPTLLRAFAVTAQAVPAAKLVIIGQGEREAELRELVATLGIGSRVIFAGAMDQAFRLMPAFDAFVLTSVYEAFGRVLLEAMAARLPIVATRAGGIPQAVGSIATLCDCGDVTSIAQAMTERLGLPPTARAALGQQAFQHLVDHFSSQRFQAQLLAFVERHAPRT